MSIIYKGLNPKNHYGLCILTINGELITADGKHYQAIQIKRPHGRLIDADALETVFKDMAKCEWNQKASPISWAYAFEDIIDEIYDAPTILEAEE